MAGQEEGFKEAVKDEREPREETTQTTRLTMKVYFRCEGLSSGREPVLALQPCRLYVVRLNNHALPIFPTITSIKQ